MAGEMTQCLRALAALLEDQGSVLAPTWWLTTLCSSSRRDPTPTSELCEYCIHVYRHRCKQNTCLRVAVAVAVMNMTKVTWERKVY